MLADNIEAYWKFDGNANDSGPYNRDGYTGGITYTSGIINQAAVYNSYGDNIEIQGWSGIIGTNARSIAVWYRAATVPTFSNNALTAWGINQPGAFWLLQVTKSGYPGQLLVSVNGSYKYGNTNLCDDEWHLIVVTFPAAGTVDDIKIYVDAQEDTPYLTTGGSTEPDTSSYGPGSIYLGYNYYQDATISNAYLDEFAIWSRELTLEEVEKLWNDGNGITYEDMFEYQAVSTLGHNFAVKLPRQATLGHKFTVPPSNKLIGSVPENDLDKFSEDLALDREEPEQLRVSPVSAKQAEVKETEQKRVEDTVNNFKEWLTAAAQMQTVLGDKLKNRQVTVDPKINPAVRDAIRRLFGIDSSTITYDMFKQALEWRSQLIKEGREDTYGSSR